MKKMNNIKINKEAQNSILDGVNKIADCVKLTMGAKGNLVLIQDISGGIPIITKDGATVAEHIDNSDVFQDQVGLIVKQATRNMAERVGDGTTTTTVLIQALLKNAFNSEKDLTRLQIEYGRCAKYVASEIRNHYKKKANKDYFYEIARTSCNGDAQAAMIIKEAFDIATSTGSVFVTKSDRQHTVVKSDSGMRLDSGWATHLACNRGRETYFENPLILIINEKVENLDKIKDYYEYASEHSQPLVMFCSEVTEEVIMSLMLAQSAGSFETAIVRIPELGERAFDIVSDLEAFTDATAIKGLCYEAKLGTVDSIVIEGDKTTLNKEHKGPLYDIVVDSLLREIKVEEDEREKEFKQKRYGYLTSKTATIEVGAVDAATLRELKDRIDDGVGAVKSAYRGGGAIPGGGNTLAFIASFGKEMMEECPEFMTALFAPRDQIYNNAGKESNTEVDYNQGWDLSPKDGDGHIVWSKDLLKSGVVDSAEITASAVETACSVVKLLMRTKGIIQTRS